MSTKNIVRLDRRPYIQLQPIPPEGLSIEVLRNQLLHWVQPMQLATAFDSDTIDTVVNDSTLHIWEKMCLGIVPNCFINEYKNYAITVLKNKFLTIDRQKKLKKYATVTRTVNYEAAVEFELIDIEQQPEEDKFDLEKQYQLLEQAISCLPQDRQRAIQSVFNKETSFREHGGSWYYYEKTKEDLKYIIARLIKGEKPEDIRKLSKYRPKRAVYHQYSFLNDK